MLCLLVGVDRYLVVQKPTKKADALQMLLDYINSGHAGETGIVYCLSRDVREADRQCSAVQCSAGIPGCGVVGKPAACASRFIF